MRIDGRPFLIVLRGGRSRYSEPVDDPFFSAHTIDSYDSRNTRFGYISDYEATAIGCVEQYRFCSPLVDFCTEWGPKYQTRWQLHKLLVSQGHEWEAAELMFLHSFIAVWTSVFSCLVGRIQKGLLPLRPASRRDPFIDLFDTKNQWSIDVETWFRKAFLDAIFYARITARFNPDDEPADELNLCGRILFWDKDYTTIHVFRYLISVSVFFAIFIVSSPRTWEVVHDIPVYAYESARRLVSWEGRAPWRRVRVLGQTG
jgi:hypothetical protein